MESGDGNVLEENHFPKPVLRRFFIALYIQEMVNYGKLPEITTNLRHFWGKCFSKSWIPGAGMRQPWVLRRRAAIAGRPRKLGRLRMLRQGG